MNTRLRFLIVSILLFVVCLLPNIACAALEITAFRGGYGVERIPIEPVSEKEDRMQVHYDSNGFFEEIEYWVTATGATGGTRYQTTMITMELCSQDGVTRSEKLEFTCDQLGGWSPSSGHIEAGKIVITSGNIVKAVQEQIGGMLARDEDAALAYFQSFAKVKIGAGVRIIDSSGAGVDGPF